MLAKYDPNYDRMMMEIHEVTKQHIVLRNLIEHCEDKEFVMYLLDRIHLFMLGQKARDFFEITYNHYKNAVAISDAKKVITAKFPKVA